MIKIWKIGTNIFSYVERWKEWSDKNISKISLSKGDSKEVEFIFSNGETEVFKKSTASQIIRVLISLGLLSLRNEETLKKNSNVVANGKEYDVKILNSDTSLKDHLYSSTLEACERIFISDRPIYPSEEQFIFSLLSSYFSQIDKRNEKFIEQKIEGKEKVSNFSKYYIGITDLLIKAKKENEDRLQEYLKYIVGFSTNSTKLFSSISNTLPKEEARYFMSMSIDDEMPTKPRTFGNFIRENLNVSHSVKIPVYQRKYVWEEKHVTTLMNDILQVEEFSSHYIGNVIIQTSTTNAFETEIKLIDGQQRLTTLIIIARAIYDFSKYKNVPCDSLLNSRFNPESDDKFSDTFRRIEGNDDFEAFRHVVDGLAFSSEVKTFKSNIINNYKVALEWLSSNLTTEKQIKLFWMNLLNKIVFVAIDARKTNEYVLFEKLNTGGKDLTTIELLKNYLLNEFSNENYPENAAQKIFEDNIGSKFDSKNIDKEMNTFIISLLRFKNNRLTDDTLFNQYKELIVQERLNDDTSDIKAFIESIGKDINLFLELSIYDRYSKPSSSLKGIADFLYMLDGRSVYLPLIMKIIDLNSSDKNNLTINEVNKIRKYLRIIEIFEVRLQVASYRGQSLSSKIEDLLENFNENTTPNEFWEMVSGGTGSTSIPSIEELKTSLKTQSIANKPAKLIMTRIENYFYLENNWEFDKEIKFRGIFESKSNREHLMPSNWRDHWSDDIQKWTGKSFKDIEEITNKYINFIGNAFPIPEWSNKSIKDSSFTKKINAIGKKAYSKDLFLFKGIKGRLDPVENVFSYEEIIKRTEQIADIAAEIWSDFK